MVVDRSIAEPGVVAGWSSELHERIAHRFGRGRGGRRRSGSIGQLAETMVWLLECRPSFHYVVFGDPRSAHHRRDVPRRAFIGPELLLPAVCFSPERPGRIPAELPYSITFLAYASHKVPRRRSPQACLAPGVYRLWGTCRRHLAPRGAYDADDAVVVARSVPVRGVRGHSRSASSRGWIAARETTDDVPCLESDSRDSECTWIALLHADQETEAPTVPTWETSRLTSGTVTISIRNLLARRDDDQKCVRECAGGHTVPGVTSSPRTGPRIRSPLACSATSTGRSRFRQGPWPRPGRTRHRLHPAYVTPVCSAQTSLSSQTVARQEIGVIGQRAPAAPLGYRTAFVLGIMEEGRRGLSLQPAPTCLATTH